jgi:hypothetical protein
MSELKLSAGVEQNKISLFEHIFLSIPENIKIESFVDSLYNMIIYSFNNPVKQSVVKFHGEDGSYGEYITLNIPLPEPWSRHLCDEKVSIEIVEVLIKKLKQYVADNYSQSEIELEMLFDTMKKHWNIKLSVY